MSTSHIIPHHLYAIIDSLKSLDKCHAERLQPCGCPAMRLILSLFHHMQYISEILHPAICLNPEVPPYVQDLGSPQNSCHVSSVTTNHTHEFLPNNLLDHNNDAGYPMSMSDSMNTDTFDTLSSLISDDFLARAFDPTADAVLSPISCETAVSQWDTTDVSLIGESLNLDQTCPWMNEDTYNPVGGYPLPVLCPQTQSPSSSVFLESATLPGMTSPEESVSSLGSSCSSWEEDSRSLVCRWNHCGSHLNPEKSGVSKHLQASHDVKPGGDKEYLRCMWEGCDKHMKKESISRHIVAVHLSKKTECDGCGRKFARWDSKLRHVKNCKRECPDLEPEQHHDEARVKRIRLSSDLSS